MRNPALISLALFLFFQSSTFAVTSTPQAAAPASDPQAVSLIAQAHEALGGTSNIADIRLQANAQWIVGGTKASGTARLQAKGTKESRLDISAGEVRRSEIRNDAENHAGQWIGPDGVRHDAGFHNCLGPVAWFAPYAVIDDLSSSSSVLHYRGKATRNGVALDHIQAYVLNSEKNPRIASDLEKLSTVEIFIDASTHFPAVIIFNTHPDDDYGRDIPIEIRFADYRTVNGTQIPFHIQRFIQGNLNLDFTITSAAINNGLAQSEFALQ